LTETELICL